MNRFLVYGTAMVILSGCAVQGGEPRQPPSADHAAPGGDRSRESTPPSAPIPAAAPTPAPAAYVPPPPPPVPPGPPPEYRFDLAGFPPFPPPPPPMPADVPVQ